MKQLRYMYVLVCEGCRYDLGMFEEFAEPGETWSPAEPVICGFPQHKTHLAAYIEGCAKYDELFQEESRKCVRGNFWRRLQFWKPFCQVMPNKYTVEVMSISLDIPTKDVES